MRGGKVFCERDSGLVYCVKYSRGYMICTMFSPVLPVQMARSPYMNRALFVILSTKARTRQRASLQLVSHQASYPVVDQVSEPAPAPALAADQT